MEGCWEKERHGGDRTQAARPLRALLTRAGIAWLAVQYRLAPGVRYPAPVEDVLEALRFAQRDARRLQLDPLRLALVGESAGGHPVVDAAIRSPTRLSAAFSVVVATASGSTSIAVTRQSGRLSAQAMPRRRLI